MYLFGSLLNMVHSCRKIYDPGLTNAVDYTRDHSGYGHSQWKTTLQCNVVSHWLSPYPEWSQLYGKQWDLIKLAAGINQELRVIAYCNQNYQYMYTSSPRNMLNIVYRRDVLIHIDFWAVLAVNSEMFSRKWARIIRETVLQIMMTS